jgi:hypothetical protein
MCPLKWTPNVRQKSKLLLSGDRAGSSGFARSETVDKYTMGVG